LLQNLQKPLTVI